MGVYKAAIVTENGQNLIAQALANEKPLIFTSAKTSSYSYPVGTNVPALTGLQDVVQSVIPSDSKVLNGNVAQVSVRFDNDGIDQAYLIQTIGLYAKIEDGAETLFSVTQATTPDEMPVQSDVSPSAYIYNIQHTVQNASQITLSVNPAGTATVQDVMEIKNPEFDDSGTVSGISSFPDFLNLVKSKMNFFQFFRNFKAGMQFVLHAGQIVNNCVTDNAGLPLSAAQGKALMDLYTQLYSDTQTRFAANASGNTYNSVSDFPQIGSGFGVTSTGFTLCDGFTIPQYSRICFMNYGLSKDGALFAIDGSSNIYSAFRDKGMWKTYKTFAAKSDLPNLFAPSPFPKENVKSNHYQAIQNIWNKLPQAQPFICTVQNDNQFVIVGYIYGNYKYGAVLYIAFNTCGIVKCAGGTFSNTVLG